MHYLWCPGDHGKGKMGGGWVGGGWAYHGLKCVLDPTNVYRPLARGAGVSEKHGVSHISVPIFSSDGL